ncbi:hypothetical protein ID875_06965 [Streptomyces globisporus]|uniref:Uncharacterized protein n=1 Tax=Streptomyces globisporus TaxID=1908 RepID=A0A927BI96_STRGL|nr:hypothetical protein [Streptomyces globisporus]
MGSELMFGGFGQEPERRGRLNRDQRALQARADRDRTNLLYEAQKQEFTAALRTRMSQNGLQDARDVGELARELAGDDPFLASLLGPIAEEFGRQVVRDVRYFGKGLTR